MKFLMLNGSPKENGNTARALAEMRAVFEKENVEVELVHVGYLAVRGCTSCGACFKQGHCVIEDDIVNELAQKFAACDGLVLGSPVYYAGANGALTSFMDRVFYSDRCAKKNVFAFKPAAAVASARRAGTTPTLDQINRYFEIASMPIVTSTYWNEVHGNLPEEVEQDDLKGSKEDERKAEPDHDARTAQGHAPHQVESCRHQNQRLGAP